MSSDVAYPDDRLPTHNIDGKWYHVCQICNKNIPISVPVFKPNGGKIHCPECWQKRNRFLKEIEHPPYKESPSEYGKLGMKELLIKSLLPTYEEIEIESFSFTVDNHLELNYLYDEPGVHQTMPTSYDMTFKTKHGHTYHIHKDGW